MINPDVCSCCGEIWNRQNLKNIPLGKHKLHLCPDCYAEYIGQKDTVSKEVYDQTVRERNVAIGQLKELGYELGQKIEPQTARWIVKIDVQGWYRVCSNCGNKPLKNQWGTGDALSSHCPSCGKEMVIIENPEE